MEHRAAPSTPIDMLATRKDAGLFVAAILQRPPQGINGPPVVASSATLTFDDVCAAMSKATGRKTVYRQGRTGQMAKDFPAFGAVFEEVYELFNDYGLTGNMETLGREEVSLLVDSGRCQIY